MTCCAKGDNFEHASKESAKIQNKLPAGFLLTEQKPF